MKKEALSILFYREIEKVVTNEALETKEKIEALYRLLTTIFVELTRRERLQFSTLFARIAYSCHRHDIPKKLQYYIHAFRKRALLAMKDVEEEPELIYQLGIKALAEVIEAFLESSPTQGVQAFIPEEWPVSMRMPEVKAFRDKVRAVILEDDMENSCLIGQEEGQPEERITIRYNEAERNDSFMPSIQAIRDVFGVPCTVNLIDVEIDKEGVYHPRAFVIEPDYLVDVTAVAECFKPDGETPWSYLLKKYLPVTPNIHLMIGNIANFFLDELMTNPELAFREVFTQAFQLSPLAFCLFDNREVKDIMQRSQKHFINLKYMASRGLKDKGINPEHCYLEPSFYSETYGLQGRLDVLYQEKSKAAIVELKSGKPFMANVYGLSVNHFTQTLLYDLIVRSAFGRQLDPTNYILYSGLDEKPLRFAPRVKAQQYEAIQLRNQLLAIENMLAKLGSFQGDLLEQGQRFFGRLRVSAFPSWRGFFRRDLELFERVFDRLSPLAKRYFTAFSGFIAREHQLAKIGSQDVGRNGLASLWLSGLEEKLGDFEIFSHLKIIDIKVKETEPLIFFEKTEHTHPLANFRIGDIAVLYPHQEEGVPVLANQIFKCTIIDISVDQVAVRLRSRQFNDAIFAEHTLWNLEHDLLDSSFSTMYRSLLAFARSNKEKQDLLLATAAPRAGEPQSILVPDELTEEQQDILQRAISAEDYFLLWGPPGTGKTSMMLKHLVSYLLDNTEENILLLAYTNRAVDEICEAVEKIRPDIRRHYLRIGSKYSTSERFRGQLLKTKINAISSRKELKHIIASHRIIIGTVSSIAGKPELLALKRFDRVIIDEASQILEPLLVGLLPNFNRFILVGDHKQLPAVVIQDSETSAVKDHSLQEVGLHNLRNSLFERLYKQCILNGWYWAYAQLSHQGRMHKEVMAFPNRYFYHSTLKILPDSIPIHYRQLEAMPFKFNFLKKAKSRAERLLKDRISFLDTPVDANSLTQKTNEYEALEVAQLIKQFQALYEQYARPITANSIGVITPYRAQIAQIKDVIEKEGLVWKQHYRRYRRTLSGRRKRHHYFVAVYQFFKPVGIHIITFRGRSRP